MKKPTTKPILTNELFQDKMLKLVKTNPVVTQHADGQEHYFILNKKSNTPVLQISLFNSIGKSEIYLHGRQILSIDIPTRKIGYTQQHNELTTSQMVLNILSAIKLKLKTLQINTIAKSPAITKQK